MNATERTTEGLGRAAAIAAYDLLEMDPAHVLEFTGIVENLCMAIDVDDALDHPEWYVLHADGRYHWWDEDEQRPDTREGGLGAETLAHFAKIASRHGLLAVETGDVTPRYRGYKFTPGRWHIFEVHAALREARRVERDAPPEGWTPLDGHLDELDSDPGWMPADLGEVLDGPVEQPRPDLLARTDGVRLFYRGAVNSLYGGDGEGKSWVSLVAVAQEIDAGRNVLVFDLEDDRTSFVGRLLLLGADPRRIRDHVRYINPRGPFETRVVAQFVRRIEDEHIGLVIIDSLGEAFGYDDVDENRDLDVVQWNQRVARPFAEAGAAVVLIDHATKAKTTSGLHASGSKRKRAMVTGSSYFVAAPVRFSKETGGVVQITCAKDRHGTHRQGEQIATLTLAATPGGLTTALEAIPTRALPKTGGTDLVGAVVQTLRALGGGPVSLRTLQDAIEVAAGNEAKRSAIRQAVADGALIESAGPNRSCLFTIAGDPT